jgi:hypothetical protein
MAEQALERARFSYWLSPHNSAVLRPLVQALALSARVNEHNDKQLDASQLAKEGFEILHQMKGDRASAEYQALKVRVMMARPEKQQCIPVLDVLERERRRDPYLKAWVEEVGLYA